MVTRDKTYTADEFYAMESDPNNPTRYELIQGYLVAMPQFSFYLAVMTAKITAALGKYVYIDHDPELGFAFDSNCGYTLSEHDVLRPRGSFVSRERLPKGLPDRLYFAPDIAVEVITPEIRRGWISYRTELFFKTGAKVIWIIYPDEEYAEIRTATDSGYNVVPVNMDGVLTAKSVLPDFELPMRKIFPKIDPKQEA